jgi:hypothetical protein
MFFFNLIFFLIGWAKVLEKGQDVFFWPLNRPFVRSPLLISSPKKPPFLSKRVFYFGPLLTINPLLTTAIEGFLYPFNVNFK